MGNEIFTKMKKEDEIKIVKTSPPKNLSNQNYFSNKPFIDLIQDKKFDFFIDLENENQSKSKKI